MHELSIALRVREMAEEHLGAGRAGGLVAVGLDVGDDSGLEPASLAFCLDALLAEPPFQGARAEIARCPGDVLRLTWLEVDDER